mgnify:FL=1
MVYCMNGEEGVAVEHIKQDKIINVPNALTLLRILLLPVVVWRFVIGDATGALIAYMAAMLTDALDGIIARKTNQITALGKLLDPIADKLSLVTLLGLFVSSGEIPLWVLAIILFKEVMMVIGGGVALKHGIVVYALPIGKVTTVTFVLSMVVRFMSVLPLADVLLWISVALSMVALVWYAVDLMKKLGLKADSTK